MNIGMMRVKNEARWIRRSIESVLLLCDHVFLLDDRSTDTTPMIAAEVLGNRGTIIHQSESTIDEVRDKNLLLDAIRREYPRADYVVCIDGDEELIADHIGPLRRAMAARRAAYSLPILYAWGDPNTIRCDGVYSRFRRASVFWLRTATEFRAVGAKCGFHCGNVPANHHAVAVPVNSPILHYGYMLPEDRIRKYHWYNQVDPGNASEDNYRHIAQGDLPELPADAIYRHAGPLQVRAINFPQSG